ncbi:30S ribosomal protein S26e [Candidatus Geothermarchaeota archaeon]|mgnify:CR=1 FL=1|nr:MAG: 30S ribosomal protein S26e [Candidatus Geothermarchaeota archaeon]
MPKKRKSRGRAKGKGKGRSKYTYCSNCGARIPRDKAIRVVRYYSPVDPMLARELEKEGAIIMKQKVVKTYCVSCAVHYGIVKIGGIGKRRT